MNRLRAVAPLVSALLLAALTVLPIASAQRRGGGLRANIYLTQARLPAAGTEQALLGFVRGHQARRLVETTEADLNTRKWLADMVVNFSAPPGDLEFHVLFYDMTDGARAYLEDLSIYLNDRQQRTYVQRVTLRRPRFRPNRRYEMTVTVRHTEVGTARFDTEGQEEERSGVVSFGEDETRGR